MDLPSCDKITWNIEICDCGYIRLNVGPTSLHLPIETFREMLVEGILVSDRFRAFENDINFQAGSSKH